MTRYRASGLHLLMSAIVATVVLTAMLTIWYPGGYFTLMGGAGLLFILVGVDVCLGPLVTLVVFKSGKKGLAFDLAVIAMLQMSAMAYGVYVMSQARPVYTVFAVDKFIVAAANEIDDAEFAKALKPEFRERPLFGPKMVVAIPPTDKKAKEDLVFAAMAGLDMHQFPKLYAPYEANKEMVLKAAKPLSVLRAISPEAARKVDSFKAGHPGGVDDYVFVPIKGPTLFMSLVFEAKTGRFVGFVDQDPYPV